MSAFVKLIENPFEENKEKNFTIKNNTTVSEIEGFDKQRSVVYVNGRHVTNDYILRKNDVCVIRNYPAEASTALAVIGFVALFGIALAGTDIMLKTFNGEGIWDSLYKELHPENKNTTNQEQVETLPTLSGGKNQSALGKSIPLILGKTLFTPYTIGLPYNTISGKDGEEQYYHSLFLIGYNDIEIRNVSIGLEELASNVENVTDGVLSITSSKYRDSQLELRQSGEVSLYNCKVVQENFSAELLHPQAPEGETSIGEYVYAFSARYPKQVEIEFTFSGLIAYDKESGEEKETEVDVTVEYSLDGGTTWINCSELIDLSNATGSSVYVKGENYIKFKNKKAKTLRYVLRQSFTKSDMDNCYAKVVQYRILRTNESSTETTVIDKIYFSAIRTWCYNASLSTTTLENQIPMNAKERDKTARLGLSIKVTKDLVNSFDKINLIAYSKAPVWDGGGWTTKKEVTRNPIALALHVMTGNFRDEAYRYNFTENKGYYSSNKIDLESFGEAYEMCEEIKDFGEGIEDKKYLCDGAVVSSTKTIDLVNKILACARSSLVLNGSKYEILTDKEQDYPLLVLNNNNLLSLAYTKNFNDIPDGQQVRYISERNYYQQDTIVVKPLGSSPVSSSDNLQTVEYPYITDPYHAKAMSLYQQACLSLRPESYLAKVTTEGGLAEIGSLISVQTDVLLTGIGDGAEITELITDPNTEFDIIGDGSGHPFVFVEGGTWYGDCTVVADLPKSPKTKGFVYWNSSLDVKSTEEIVKGGIFYTGCYYTYNGTRWEELLSTPFGTITANYHNRIIGVKTDGHFTVTDVTANYGIVINIVDGLGIPRTYKIRLSRFSEKGDYSDLYFAEPVSRAFPIEEGCVLSFGLFGNETIETICIGKNEAGDGTYELSLVPYDEQIYVADSTIIHDFDPKVTPPYQSGIPISYGDKVEVATKLDLMQESSKLIASVASLYNNHIITLYKTSADVLTSTGITTMLTYNFSNNQATWVNPALANGWSTTVPQDLTNCWVTSATAYGKATTDVIQANEWARPVSYGANGYNTVTIHLYQRLSTEPQNLPTDLTYRFESGDMACSNYNGWTVGIPPIDENKTPCWEIHATALSKNSTDTIETSEWSEPAKIFMDGYSKEEIEAMIYEHQNETPKITFSPSTSIFALDEDCKISIPQSAYMDITVIQNDIYLDFTFGHIDLPSGVTVASSALTEGGQRLTFIVAQGTRLRNSIIIIPINYVYYTKFDIIGDGSGHPFVFVEGGTWYGDCTVVADLPKSPKTDGFIYWNSSLDVKSTEEIVKGGIFYTGCYYTYNGTRWEELLSTPFGTDTEFAVTHTEKIIYTFSTVAGGRYEGAVKTISGIPANPIIGDYFTWTGTNNTPYSGSGFTKLHSGSIYSWNGQQWEIETSNRHMGIALPDVLSVAEEDLKNNNSEVILAIQKMIAWETVTKNIKVTGEAFINSTITASLTIGRDSTTGNVGTIQSANYSELNNTGWIVKGDGSAEFRQVTVGNTEIDDYWFTARDYFVTTNTEANVASKTATVEGFKLTIGSRLVITFTNPNTASNPTLNINNTGDIPITGINDVTEISKAIGIYDGKSYNCGENAEKTARQNASNAKLDLSTSLGYSSWSDMYKKAMEGKTVIKNGLINTDLIFSQGIVIKKGGYIQSNNWASYSTGWKISEDTAEFNGVTIVGADFILSKLTAGDVVNKEYNNVYEGRNLYCKYFLTPMGSGSMRIKINYTVNEVTDFGPNISIKGKDIAISKGTHDTYVDITFTDYENIPIIFSTLDQPLIGGGSLKINKLQVCLNRDVSMFKAYLMFALISSEQSFAR